MAEEQHTDNQPGPKPTSDQPRVLRRTLRVITLNPAFAMAVSLAVHASLVTLCATTSGLLRRTVPPEIRLPKGDSVVEARPVPRRWRTVRPPRRRAENILTPTRGTPVWIEAPPAKPDIIAVITPPELLPAAETRPFEPRDEPTLAEFVEPRIQTPEPPEPSPPSVEEVVATLEVADRGAQSPRPDPAAARAARRGIDRGAEVVNIPSPRYPASCRRRGQEGLVRLEVEVLADGSVGTITILTRAEYPKLNRAAVDAVGKAHFRPALANGVPVSATIIVPIRFRLK